VINLRRLAMSMVAAIALVGLAVGFSAPRSPQPGKPKAVELVSPAGGDLDLRQVQVSADLAPGYTGVLELDGREVNPDDTQFVEALNTVILKPQPDSDFRQLTPGRHCVTVDYWPIGQSRAESHGYRWCFNLH